MIAMSAKMFFLNCIIMLNGIFIVRGVAYYTEKPSFLPSCRIYEPGFTNCSTHSIQKLMDQLAIGIPEITETLGPFDPLNVRDIYFKQDNNEVATLSANLTGVVVTGFGKTIIKESRVSKKDAHWETKIFLPEMRVNANYQMAGRILLIPLQGSGKMFFAIENLDIFAYTTTRLYEKGGFTFANVTGVLIDVNMTRVRCNFDNLFNGRSKEVERSTNEFFNENWREFFAALKPTILDTVESIFFDVLSKVCHLIPANFFIEDIPTPEEFYRKKDTTT